MKTKFICIMCPVGCELTVTKNDSEITVSGNRCVRGKIYGEQEVTNPSRIVTTTIKYENQRISVKTANPVPKDKVFDVLNEISKIRATNVKVGDFLIKNIMGYNSDIVVTGVLKTE